MLQVEPLTGEHEGLRQKNATAFLRNLRNMHEKIDKETKSHCRKVLQFWMNQATKFPIWCQDQVEIAQKLADTW